MVGVRRTGLSPLVAIILLIAITVAAAVVVAGVFFNLSSIAGRRPQALIDQVKIVASPTSGAANLAIVLKNTGDVAISGNPTVQLSGLPAGCGLAGPTTWNGNRNPGGVLSGTSSAPSGCAGLVGTTVTVQITVNFADNSQQILLTGATGTIA